MAEAKFLGLVGRGLGTWAWLCQEVAVRGKDLLGEAETWEGACLFVGQERGCYLGAEEWESQKKRGSPSLAGESRNNACYHVVGHTGP